MRTQGEGFTAVSGLITATGSNYIKALLHKVLHKHMTGEGPHPVLIWVGTEE